MSFLDGGHLPPPHPGHVPLQAALGPDPFLSGGLAAENDAQMAALSQLTQDTDTFVSQQDDVDHPPADSMSFTPSITAIPSVPFVSIGDDGFIPVLTKQSKRKSGASVSFASHSTSFDPPLSASNPSSPVQIQTTHVATPPSTHASPGQQPSQPAAPPLVEGFYRVEVNLNHKAMETTTSLVPFRSIMKAFLRSGQSAIEAPSFHNIPLLTNGRGFPASDDTRSICKFLHRNRFTEGDSHVGFLLLRHPEGFNPLLQDDVLSAINLFDGAIKVSKEKFGRSKIHRAGALYGTFPLERRDALCLHLESTLCKGFGKPMGSYPLKVSWEEIHSPNETDPITHALFVSCPKDQLVDVISGLSLVYGAPGAHSDSSRPALRFSSMSMLKESTPEALTLFIQRQAVFLAHNVTSFIRGLRPLDTPITTPDGSVTIHSLLMSMQFEGKHILHAVVPHGRRKDTVILASHKSMFPITKGIHKNFWSLVTHCYAWLSESDIFESSMVEPTDLPLQQLQLVDRQQGAVKLHALFADLEEFPPLSDDDSSHRSPPRRPQGAWGAPHPRGLVSCSPLLAPPRSRPLQGRHSKKPRIQNPTTTDNSDLSSSEGSISTRRSRRRRTNVHPRSSGEWHTPSTALTQYNFPTPVAIDSPSLVSTQLTSNASTDLQDLIRAEISVQLRSEFQTHMQPYHDLTSSVNLLTTQMGQLMAAVAPLLSHFPPPALAEPSTTPPALLAVSSIPPTSPSGKASQDGRLH